MLKIGRGRYMRTMTRRWTSSMMGLIMGSVLLFAGYAETMMESDKAMMKEKGMMKEEGGMMKKEGEMMKEEKGTTEKK